MNKKIRFGVSRCFIHNVLLVMDINFIILGANFFTYSTV